MSPLRIPQNTDPRAAFRDYAVQLSNDTSKTDCLKLALLVYKAGQLWSRDTTMRTRGEVTHGDGGVGSVVDGLLNGLTEISGVSRSASDPNYRVGVMRNDPYYAHSFSTTGFLPQFQDYTPGSQNQVRHFVGWFAAGADVPSFLARHELYDQEGTERSSNADVALGLAAINLGGNFTNGRKYNDLAQTIWHDICGQSGALPRP
jgi:hypothetical protein